MALKQHHHKKIPFSYPMKLIEIQDYMTDALYIQFP